MKPILVYLLCLSMCSCFSTREHYRSSEPQCLEYAIASCRAAILEDGLRSGIIHYIPVWGAGDSHCVIWVIDKKGKEKIYDPSYRKYRTISDKAIILHKGVGVDLGALERMLALENKTK